MLDGITPATFFLSNSTAQGMLNTLASSSRYKTGREVRTPHGFATEIILFPPNAWVRAADGFNGCGKEEWVKIARDVLWPAVGKDIEIRVPHGDVFALGRAIPDTFTILVWSTPFETARLPRTPDRIWDIPVDLPTHPFQPSGEGECIFDEAGWPVAELFPNALYIHHDLAHHGSANEFAIFRRLLLEVVRLMTTPRTEEDKAKARRIMEELQARFRATYIKECSARFEKILASTKEAIQKGEAKVTELQRQLVIAIRETRGSARKLDQLLASNAALDEKHGTEFDKLSRLPKVRSVQARSGVVSVFTDVLYCVDPRTKKRHEIGAFRIDIHVGGEENCVRWFNLTRRISGNQAPHVFAEGRACFGNSAEIFAELIADYEFAAAAMVAIQFVESVNVDDSAGRHISDWPLAPEESAVPAPVATA